MTPFKQIKIEPLAADSTAVVSDVVECGSFESVTIFLVSSSGLTIQSRMHEATDEGLSAAWQDVREQLLKGNRGASCDEV
jgi:hypothetical protein